MWMVVLKAMAPSFGMTNSTGTPRAFRIWMALKLPGEMSIWPCWNRVASWPGLAATAARLGRNASSALKAGSMLDSDPPCILASSTMNPVPSVEFRLVMPTRPLNSGFHRSAQEVGGVFTVSGL